MIQMSRRVSRGMVRASFVGLIAATMAVAACTSPTSPTVRVAFTQTDIKVGTGAEAATGKTIMVLYSGWLYDNTKSDKKGDLFDETPADQPFVFKLGAGQVIQGWDLGIVGMKVGGIRQLIIPSALAYARVGAGSTIPPNATLVFQIELLSVAGG